MHNTCTLRQKSNPRCCLKSCLNSKYVNDIFSLYICIFFYWPLKGWFISFFFLVSKLVSWRIHKAELHAVTVSITIYHSVLANSVIIMIMYVCHYMYCSHFFHLHNRKKQWCLTSYFAVIIPLFSTRKKKKKKLN